MNRGAGRTNRTADKRRCGTRGTSWLWPSSNAKGWIGLPNVEQQKRLEVRFRGALVGEFVTDFVVERDVLIEVKAVKAFDDVHIAQCLNYPKATGLPVCLLVNFGTARAVIKRVVNDF